VQQGRRALPWILLGRRSVPLCRRPKKPPTEPYTTPSRRRGRGRSPRARLVVAHGSDLTAEPRPDTDRTSPPSRGQGVRHVGRVRCVRQRVFMARWEEAGDAACAVDVLCWRRRWRGEMPIWRWIFHHVTLFLELMLQVAVHLPDWIWKVRWFRSKDQCFGIGNSDIFVCHTPPWGPRLEIRTSRLLGVRSSNQMTAAC
jgi:hypothetical protein